MAVPTDKISLEHQTSKDSGLLHLIEPEKELFLNAPISVALPEYATAEGRGFFTQHRRVKGLKYAGRGSLEGLRPQFKSKGLKYTKSRYGTVDGSSNPDERIVASPDGFQQTVVVAGSSSIADNGESIWLLEDGSWSLTEPDRNTAFSGDPDGEILKWISGTTCIIYAYGAIEKSLIALCGGLFYYEKFHIHFPYVADSTFLADLRMNHRGKIVELFTVNDVALVGGGTFDLNGSLDGGTTDILSSDLAVGGTATVGSRHTGTVNTDSKAQFNQGDQLSFTIANKSGTFTSGQISIYLRIKKLLGH